MVIQIQDVAIISGSIIIVIIMLGVVKWMDHKYKIRELNIKSVIKKSSINLKPEKKVKIKEVDKPDTEVEYYNALKTKKSKLSIRYWRDLMLDRRHPDKTLLINMEMTNGFHRTFIIKNINNQFKYKGSVYIIDNDLKYYNLDSKLYQLDYHENMTIPVKRIIPVDQIKKQVESSKIIPSQSINPALIEKFIQSKILESLMKGGQFIESLRKFSFYLIIIMTIGAIHFVLFVYGSGMLQGLKVPGF